MYNAVVTGANGYIGRNLVEYLIDNGVMVYAFDIQKGSIRRQCGDKFSYVQLDFSNTRKIEKIFKNISVDVMYHLSWAGVSSTEKNDINIQLNNIKLTIDGLMLSKRIGSKKTICLGSVSEYAYSGERVSGNDVPAPGDVYAATKVAAHHLAKTFAEQNDIPLIWTLVSSVYGPGRDDNNLISYTIKSLLNDEKPLFTKLEQKWDYIYIDDLIKMLYMLGLKGVRGKVYPLGSQEEKSLAEYVEAIRKEINPNLPIGVGEIAYKSGRADTSIIDRSSFNSDCGNIQTISFEKGIKKTIKYYKEKLLHDI